MTKFWDKMFDLILSKGQREKHEKYLWDKKSTSDPNTTSFSSRSPSLDKLSPVVPEFRPTILPAMTGTKSSSAPEGPPRSPTSPGSAPKTEWTSPHTSRPGSPGIPVAHTKLPTNLPRAPLPRRPREDRAYLSLEPLMETHTLTAPDAQKVGQRRESGQSTVSSASTSPTRLARVHSQTAVPLLYPVPPLSEMQGVGRYRRSINATEEFVDSNNNRNDSYADLLIAGDKRIRATSGEWSRTGRNGGNMDTTSPPPPRSAFCSRASSPVRMALYGDDQHLVGEEELEEVNGKLLFGRRKSKGSTNNGSQTTNPSSKNGSDESEGGAATTSGEAVMTTADIIAAVAKEKAATGGVGGAAAAGPFAKRRLPLGPHIARDDDNVRGRKKLSEVKNLSNNLCLKKEQTKTFLVTSENLEEAAIETDDEDVEEVESFSDTKGATMLVKATKGGAATEKERTKKGLEGPKRGRKQFRGPGQTIGVTGGMNTGARGAGQRRPPVTNRMGAGCNGGVGGKRATQNEKLQLLHMETLDEGKDLMGVH